LPRRVGALFLRPVVGVVLPPDVALRLPCAGVLLQPRASALPLRREGGPLLPPGVEPLPRSCVRPRLPRAFELRFQHEAALPLAHERELRLQPGDALLLQRADAPFPRLRPALLLRPFPG